MNKNNISMIEMKGGCFSTTEVLTPRMFVLAGPAVGRGQIRWSPCFTCRVSTREKTGEKRQEKEGAKYPGRKDSPPINNAA